MKTILAVMIGGGLGAILRHGVAVGASRVLGGGFPWGTLLVNVTGSFAIGLLVVLFDQYWQPSPEVRLFLITGVLGGYTTFSAFSLDFVTIWESGALATALLYVLLSVTLSISALFLALFLVRALAS